jgi:hypothetical protein
MPPDTGTPPTTVDSRAAHSDADKAGRDKIGAKAETSSVP